MESLFSQADRESAEKRLCPTCGHFEVIKDAECIQAMNAFLRKHLRPPTIGLEKIISPGRSETGNEGQSGEAA